MPDVREQLAVLNIEYVPNTAAQFSDYLKTDIPRWEKVIRDAGIKID